jgi:hypothetical protein
MVAKKDPLARMRAMVCRAVVRSLPGVDRSREEQLALLIAEQQADMESSRISADSVCTRNLPSVEGRNWRNYADYR